MIPYFDIIQGTPEWADIRSGIPTASAFDHIVTPTGKRSSQQEKYQYQLIAERLMGHPIIEATSRWMDRGSEAEAEAVASYEFQRELDTVKIGFCTNDAGTIGASPDRLVGDTGLLEIKVPSEAVHVGFLLQDGGAYKDYRVQVQGQLWIAEREWSDTLSYHPEMPRALYRVERDEEFIRILDAEVRAFSERLETLWTQCVERGWAKKEPQPVRAKTISEQVRDALIEMQK